MSFVQAEDLLGNRNAFVFLMAMAFFAWTGCGAMLVPDRQGIFLFDEIFTSRLGKKQLLGGSGGYTTCDSTRGFGFEPSSCFHVGGFWIECYLMCQFEKRQKLLMKLFQTWV